MKTYTDADVRKELAALVERYSYRKAGLLIGVDSGNLHRMIHAERPITDDAARAVGFRPREREWVKA